MAIRVTCIDLDTGEKEEAVIENNYVVVTHGRRYLHSTQLHGNGTAVITIKTKTREAQD